MITKQEVLDLAGEWSLGPQVVEKDYVIGWLLAAIYQHQRLDRGLVFKGGTCLKKCYLETYRFSEDLDFTVSDPELLNEQALKETFSEVAERIYESTGIEIRVEESRFDVFNNPRGRRACQGRLYYRGPLQVGGSRPRVKLDLTADELLATESVAVPISHPYSDAPNPLNAANCYAFEELFAEKVRALGERGRPRDLYDVISIFRRSAPRPPRAEVRRILRLKCAFKNVPIPTLKATDERRSEMEADWGAMLRHQLQSLPPFKEFWKELPKFFEWLEHD